MICGNRKAKKSPTSSEVLGAGRKEHWCDLRKSLKVEWAHLAYSHTDRDTCLFSHKIITLFPDSM